MSVSAAAGGNSSHSKKAANGSRRSSPSVKRTVFKKAELEYTHFIHAINIVRKLLCFKNGRSLFPIRLDSGGGGGKHVSLIELVQIIIQIVLDTAQLKNLTTDHYSPSKYCYELLQDLCVAEEACEACLCNEEVVDQLIKPLKTIMQQQQQAKKDSSLMNNSASAWDESCMLLIANVLSKLASTQCGYRQLLYNDSRQQTSKSNGNSAAHVIASFVRKALTNQLNCSLSTKEIAEYLYIVRLLYSQCQGVYLIKEFGLNNSISESWHLVSFEFFLFFFNEKNLA